MFLTALIASVTIGTISGTITYLLSKEDQRKIKESLRAYIDFPTLNATVNTQNHLITITPPGDLEQLTQLKITEDKSTLHCIFFISIMQNKVPIISFKYDKVVCRTYDEHYYLINLKKQETIELIQEFKEFIITNEWKQKIVHSEIQSEQLTKETTEDSAIDKQTDPDIQYHLVEIEKKIAWLNETTSLDVEEEHKIDVLKEDTEQILKAYHSFRDETKSAFKEKVIEALLEINGKLNELSIKKEQLIVSDIDKTISLIKKR